MNNKTHILKTWIEYYKHIIDGTKTFEIRKNDRDFKVGDELILKEYDNDKQKYTGRLTSKLITYITNYEQKDNYVVMSIIDIGDNNKQFQEEFNSILEDVAFQIPYDGSNNFYNDDIIKCGKKFWEWFSKKSKQNNNLIKSLLSMLKGERKIQRDIIIDDIFNFCNVNIEQYEDYLKTRPSKEEKTLWEVGQDMAFNLIKSHLEELKNNE